MGDHVVSPAEYLLLFVLTSRLSVYLFVCVCVRAGGRQHPAEGDAAADGRGVRPEGEEPVASPEHQEPAAAAHQGHVRRHHQQVRGHASQTLGKYSHMQSLVSCLD